MKQLKKWMQNVGRFTIMAFSCLVMLTACNENDNPVEPDPDYPIAADMVKPAFLQKGIYRQSLKIASPTPCVMS